MSLKGIWYFFGSCDLLTKYTHPIFIPKSMLVSPYGAFGTIEISGFPWTLCKTPRGILNFPHRYCNQCFTQPSFYNCLLQYLSLSHSCDSETYCHEDNFKSGLLTILSLILTKFFLHGLGWDHYCLF